MRTAIVLSLLSTTAMAADNEVVLTAGSIVTNDAGWNQFSHSQPTTLGIRGGTALTKRVSAVAEYRFQYQGVTLADSFSLVRTSYTRHLGAAGFKVNAPLHPQMPLVPYGIVEAAFFGSQMKLDDNRGSRDNPNQLRRGAITAGGYGALGIDAIPPQGEFAIGFVGHMELGWLSHGPLDMGETGVLRPQGFAFRMGGGVRF